MLARITYIIFLCYLFAAVSGLLRGFRPRLRWGLSILSVVGLTTALTELSVMISISQAVNFTTLILNIMIVTFLLFAALLALLIWVRAKKEFDQRQADLEEEEVVVAPMPLATEGAEVAPVVPVLQRLQQHLLQKQLSQLSHLRLLQLQRLHRSSSSRTLPLVQENSSHRRNVCLLLNLKR